MKELFRKLFCRHKDNNVICWHWTHGITSHEPPFLEVLLRCKTCGKYQFTTIQDPKRFDEFVSTYAEKEWADTYKPVS